MRVSGYLRLAILAVLFAACGAHGAPASEYWAYWDASNEGNAVSVDHSAWDGVLQKYAGVDPTSGVVSFSYGSLTKADVKGIGDYVDALAGMDPRTFAKLEQKAYWMNLYNALTILAVHENFQQLSQSNFQHGLSEGDWNKKRVKIAGQTLSLNDIGNRILRPIFKDHRILFGLNCTTLDCPNLSERAYTAQTIKEQLKLAGVRFINNNIGLRYADGVLHASRLFHEYLSDFATDEKMLTKVFAHYAEDMKALYALGYSGTINYMSDSRLNNR